MRSIGRPAVVLLLVMIGAGTTGAAAGTRPVVVDSPAVPVVGEGLEQALATSDTAHVVILLDVDPGLAVRKDREPLRREVARQQDRVLAALHPGDLLLRSRPNFAPILAGEVARAGLERLRHLAGIRRIDLDLPGSGGLAESVPLVRADLARALGYTGAGIVVGEVDSGVATEHPDLVGAVVGEACTCVTDGGCCPNGSTFQTGPGAAEDNHAHGTWVAGVMTSDGHEAPLGVAPDVKIVAVKVTNAADHTCCMSDVTSALDWILENRPDVAAINCSVVSSALYPGDCDNADAITGGMASIIAALRTAGIPVFAAAGNAGTPGAMSAPACVSAAVSMGATYDANVGSVSFSVCSDTTTAADQTTCFTNSDASTDLFAPGSMITTSLRNGSTSTVSGTSFSAPHATACAALLKQVDPSISAGAIENTLKATGVPVTDPRNGITFPRIDCFAAIQARSCPDADGDGYWEAGPGCPGPPYSDCDEADASIYPGAPEICDQEDNDCDGLMDEGFDPDGDSLAACVDNCPNDWNPGQADRDQDAQGDACDLDDGVIEVWMEPAGQVRWQQESGFALYDVYRGDLGGLHDTDGDGAAEDYGSCVAEDVAGPAFVDSSVPASGYGFIYLVTGRTSAGSEGDLGVASSGAPRPNVRDCADVFGLPPVIAGVSAAASAQQVACDITTPFLAYLCTSGVPGAQPNAPILVHGDYTEVRLEGQVTDPDGTPQATDITSVSATLSTPSGGSFDLGMYDDASATLFPVVQRTGDFGLDCDPNPELCSCGLRTYGVNSGDAVGADTTYTRSVALVASNLPALVQDCVMQARRQFPFVTAPAALVTIGTTARDTAGHETVWLSPPTAVVGSGAYSCSGDTCGCCILTATDPVSQCRGLPGLTSPDYPAGLCTAF
jgi:predicted lipoprotein with Yx(FWY)xxD motif